MNILVDPVLVGNLDFGIPFLYDATKKSEIMKKFTVCTVLLFLLATIYEYLSVSELWMCVNWMDSEWGRSGSVLVWYIGDCMVLKIYINNGNKKTYLWVSKL